MDDLGVRFYGKPIKSKDDLILELLNPPPVIGIDTETPDLWDKTMIGIGIATSEHYGFWVPRESPAFEMVALRHLRNPALTKIFWNLKFDMEVLEPYINNIDSFEDAELLAYTRNLPQKLYNFALDSGKSVEQRFLDFNIPQGETTLSVYGIDYMREKCCVDASLTLWAWNKLKPLITQSYYIDRNIIPSLRHMEKCGVALNKSSVIEFDNVLCEECEGLRRTIHQVYGCDPNSNQQVGTILSNQGFKLKKTPSGQFSVDETMLTEPPLDENPLAQLVLIYRGKNKMWTTYVHPLVDKDRVYTIYNIDKVITGRLSSSKPKGYPGPKAMTNMQNWPELLRQLVIPDVGPYYEFDASQAELRVIAWQSQDPLMMQTFLSGGDIHNDTMKRFGIKDRRLAKVLNFATVYGAEWFTIIAQARKIGMRIPPQDAMMFQKIIFATYRRLAEYIEETKKFIHKYGYAQTMFGRIRKADTAMLNSPDRKLVESAERMLINMPTQGSASEIVMMAMYKARAYDMRIQLHDAMYFDGEHPELSLFDGLVPFPMPFEMKQGDTWGTMEKVKK